MAGYGNDVFWPEDFCLFQNLTSNFGQGEPVFRGVEVLQPSRILNRLQRNASHARLLQSEIDDLADLAVVQALLERNDEVGRNVVTVEPFKSVHPNAAQIRTAQLHQWVALKGIEL